MKRFMLALTLVVAANLVGGCSPSGASAWTSRPDVLFASGGSFDSDEETPADQAMDKAANDEADRVLSTGSGPLGTGGDPAPGSTGTMGNYTETLTPSSSSDEPAAEAPPPVD